MNGDPVITVPGIIASAKTCGFGSLFHVSAVEVRCQRFAIIEAGNTGIVTHAILSSEMIQMGGLIDLTGQRFGRLTVIGRGETYVYPQNFRDSKKRRKTAVKWICQCDCGNTKEFFGSVLKSGKARSCGCLRFKKTQILYERWREENESGT